MKTTITNEYDNDILFQIEEFIRVDHVKRCGYDHVKIVATGPNSQCDHTWTKKEAETIRDMLNTILD